MKLQYLKLDSKSLIEVKDCFIAACYSGLALNEQK